MACQSNSAPSSITYDQHVHQTNERLISIRKALQEDNSFVSAARELLEWCSDPRAFQPPFELNLVSCLSTINEVSKRPSFDLELGYRLLSTCYNSRDQLSPANAARIQKWNEDLGQALLQQHACSPSLSQSQSPRFPLVKPLSSSSPTMLPSQKMGAQNGVPPQGQNMMWGAGPSGAVSVLTTVYPGNSANPYPPGANMNQHHGHYAASGGSDGGSHQMSQFNPSNGVNGMAADGSMVHPQYAHHPRAGSVPTQQKPGFPSQGNGFSGMGPSEGYPSQGMYSHPHPGGMDPSGMSGRFGPAGPQGNPSHAAAVQAQKAANVAAAAVATATATAVAFNDQSGMHPQGYGAPNQIPMGYGHGQVRSQYIQQGGGQYINQRGMQQIPQGMIQNSQMSGGYRGQMGMPVRGGYPQHPQMPGSVGTVHRVPPPQYSGPMRMAAGPQRLPPGYVVRPGMVGGRMGPGQMMQQGMQQHPGMPPSQYAPQQHPQLRQMRPNGMGNGMPVQGNFVPRQANGMMDPSYSQPDIKPSIVEDPKMSLPIPSLQPVLPHFRLDHNISVTNLEFLISTERYMQLTNRGQDGSEEFELQLKCFHHDDKYRMSNWPANQNQISVQVMVNNQHIPIQRTNQPLLIKNFCKPGQNTMQIAVLQCCCSHYFVLSYVRRTPLESFLRKIVQESILSKGDSLAKIKATIATQGNAEIQRTSETLSLKCPIGQSRINYPARGRECTHLQCFDLRTFLVFNQEKQFWGCPLCQKVIGPESLEVDEYVMEILQEHGGDPNVEQVSVNHFGTHEIAKRVYPMTKQEDPSQGNCAGPPAKRMKSEPGLGGGQNAGATYWQGPSQYVPGGGGAKAFSPAGGVLSPYYNGFPQSSPVSVPPAQRPPTVGPGTPVQSRYGPLTPATPGQQNPPSVGPLPVGPGGMGEGTGPPPGLSAPQPTTFQQQQSVENGSIHSTGGSQPFTPASVGSTGSRQEQQGQGNAPTSLGGNTSEGNGDLDTFFDGSTKDNLSLLSESELMQYLDPTDSADLGNQDFPFFGSGSNNPENGAYAGAAGAGSEKTGTGVGPKSLELGDGLSSFGMDGSTSSQALTFDNILAAQGPPPASTGGSGNLPEPNETSTSSIDDLLSSILND